MARDPLARPEEAIRRLYAYAAYRIGPGPDAEDLVSATLERALRYRDSYDDHKGSPAAWLAGIASRLIADGGRASPDEVSVDPAELDAPLEDFSASSLRRLELHRGIAVLDARSRELLALRFGADLKAREIAELLEMSTNAAEVALSRALGRLRTVLEAGELPPSEVQAARPLPEGG
jgi:RNA polymerase sigma-70 factor (ECF subfamily)